MASTLRTRRFGILPLFSLGLLVAPLAACGGDEKPADEQPDAGPGWQEDAGDDKPSDCTSTIAAGSDTETIQTALIEAKTGDVVCFADGTYPIDSELSLTVNDVTLRGNAKNREAVVLDYTNQTQGKNGMSVNGAGFTMEHLSVKNSHGNTIVVKGSDRVTFRNLKVTWDMAESSDNGAYAVYPLSSTNVLVEDCEIVGARDAGIYVGQSKNIIVRNNEVHGNVAGIEIENSDDALVTGNHVYDNSGGILVFALPNLEKKDGNRTIVENNVIENNNHANFGEAGTVVSYVPPGTGILVLASDATEIRNNQIRGNEGAAVLALSYQTFQTICTVSGGDNCGGLDAKTDPNLSKLYVHSNVFADNGQKPAGIQAALLGDKLENVIWDGRKPEDALDADQLCLGDEPTTLRVFGNQEGLITDGSKQSTDAKPYACALAAPFETIELAQDK